MFALLGRMGPDAKDSLETLNTIAKGKIPGLSPAAAVTVYQIDPKSDTAMAIAEFFENKDERVYAANALKKLRPTSKAVAVELVVAADSTDDEFRLAAAGTLSGASIRTPPR